MAVSVNNQQLKGLLAEKPVVTAEFFSPTCQHCKRLAKAVEELENHMNCTIVTIDIAAQPDLARQYDVTAVPTVLFFKNGEIRERLVGNIHPVILEQNIRRLEEI